jgi:hypothetical protein
VRIVRISLDVYVRSGKSNTAAPKGQTSLDSDATQCGPDHRCVLFALASRPAKQDESQHMNGTQYIAGGRRSQCSRCGHFASSSVCECLRCYEVAAAGHRCVQNMCRPLHVDVEAVITWRAMNQQMLCR